MVSLNAYNTQQKKETKKTLICVGIIILFLQIGFITLKLYLPLDHDVPWWQVLLPISICIATYVPLYLIQSIIQCCHKKPQENEVEQCLTGFMETGFTEETVENTRESIEV